MKIIGTSIMRGPNVWRLDRHKLMMLNIQFEEFEVSDFTTFDQFSNNLKNKLSKIFFGYHDWAFKKDVAGQFDKSTFVGYLVGLISLQLQNQAGMNCDFVTVESTESLHVIKTIFEYEDDKIASLAANSAVHCTNALLRNEDYNISTDLLRIKEKWEDIKPGPITGPIMSEVKKRKIPYLYLDGNPLVQIGYGANSKRIQLSVTGKTSSIGAKIASNKERAKKLLRSLGVPVPFGKFITGTVGLDSAIKNIGYPLVLKPVDGRQGSGVTVNINNYKDAVAAFRIAKSMSGSGGVVAERYIAGKDYRLLIVNHKFVAAVKRIPAMIIGDGRSTIEKLIDKVNSDPRRGTGHTKPLTTIEVDESTHNIFLESGVTLDSILPLNKPFFLKSIANLSVGGTSSDVTELVHPDNIFIAERIAKIIDLDICGLDIITPDIAIPLSLNGGVLIEVNSAPGLRLHIEPTEGKSRNVAGAIIDMLFPTSNSWRIPIIAVVSYGERATLCELIANTATRNGYKVGSATSRGISIQNVMISHGNSTYFEHAELLLKDPLVDFAIFECALDGNLTTGMAFHNCDIGIVIDVRWVDTNVNKNTLTLKELIDAASIIPRCVSPQGYAILNAGDDSVYLMNKDLQCNVAYFSTDGNNSNVLYQINIGSLVTIVEDGHVVVYDGSVKTQIIGLENNINMSNKYEVATCQDLLVFVLTAWIYKIPSEEICEIYKRHYFNYNNGNIIKN